MKKKLQKLDEVKEVKNILVMNDEAPKSPRGTLKVMSDFFSQDFIELLS